MARGRDTLQAVFRVAMMPELCPGARLLWILYRAYDGTGAGAWPGDDLVSRRLGVTDRSVRTYRQQLIRAGLLVVRRRGPQPARYWAVAPGDTSCRCPECRAADARGEHAGHVVARPPTVENLAW